MKIIQTLCDLQALTCEVVFKQKLKFSSHFNLSFCEIMLLDILESLKIILTYIGKKN